MGVQGLWATLNADGAGRRLREEEAIWTRWRGCTIALDASLMLTRASHKTSSQVQRGRVMHIAAPYIYYDNLPSVFAVNIFSRLSVLFVHA